MARTGFKIPPLGKSLRTRLADGGAPSLVLIPLSVSHGEGDEGGEVSVR